MIWAEGHGKIILGGGHPFVLCLYRAQHNGAWDMTGLLGATVEITSITFFYRGFFRLKIESKIWEKEVKSPQEISLEKFISLAFRTDSQGLQADKWLGWVCWEFTSKDIRDSSPDQSWCGFMSGCVTGQSSGSKEPSDWLCLCLALRCSPSLRDTRMPWTITGQVFTLLSPTSSDETFLYPSDLQLL